MVRGTPPRLHALAVGDQMLTCPAMQCSALIEGWHDIVQGKADRPLHSKLLEHGTSSHCELRPINAADLEHQIANTKLHTARLVAHG
eukprot:63024-Amphidinium_carterae.4